MLLRNLLRRVARPVQVLRRQTTLSTEYVRSAPSPQNAVDIFKGRWFTRFPEPLSDVRAGKLALFEDPRMAWALSELGDLRGKTVLELGPLEGAHSYMLERAGAESIVSIEANPEAYLKCLIVKETVGLRKTRFLCGDFMEYLRHAPPQFDVAFASGVLYHMLDPVETIELLSKVAPKLYLWTHYYDARIISGDRKLASMFTGSKQNMHNGFSHTLYRYEYWGSFGAREFCGGSRPHAYWLSRKDILAALTFYGFNQIHVNFEALDHPDGPAFALVGQKTEPIPSQARIS